ncbi:MAG: hypothetical protein HY694_02300 [Deltaproteobacteria bacterium]|nr:hypothetical protein [Deltaproteobacteria bacterium]
MEKPSTTTKGVHFLLAEPDGTRSNRENNQYNSGLNYKPVPTREPSPCDPHIGFSL